MIEDTSPDLRYTLDYTGYEYESAVPFVINPGKGNYQVGSINRYFVCNVNYSNIVEVNRSDYEKLDSKFYKKAKLSWKISGPKYNVYEGMILSKVGAYEYNIKNINNAKKTIDNIDSVLTDPLQFWKES